MMESEIYVKFLFDYNQELGYTENIEYIPKDQIKKINGKTIITLYGRFEEGE